MTHDIEAMSFNTAISAMMMLLNDLGGFEHPPREALEALTLLISPFAPHVAEEVWMKLGHDKSLAYERWPSFDEALCIDDADELAVQVNGKVRGHVDPPAAAPCETDARDAALAVASVKAAMVDKAIKKFIYVPGKIVNIVV